MNAAPFLAPPHPEPTPRAHRAMPRWAHVLQLGFAPPDGAMRPAATMDIGPGGLSVRTPHRLPVGSDVWLSVDLAHYGTVHVRGRVSWCRPAPAYPFAGFGVALTWAPGAWYAYVAKACR